MRNKVLKWIRREKLIEAGDCVIAGVSGGADSVCLLLILLELQREMDFSIQVVHVEHGIRGQESREDEQFVEQLCKERGVLCNRYHRDVPHFAAEHRQGMEEAARSLRYECYKEAAEAAALAYERGVCPNIRVALAHHADDNAETVLFQMIRGSGMDGLCGMSAKRQLTEHVQIIRPLLGVTRKEIEAYLEAAGQPYRTDSTNLDTDYSRNRIRREIMPRLEQINRQAVLHINQSTLLLQEVRDYLGAEVSRAAGAVCIWEEKSCRISGELFLQYPMLLQREVVHQVLCRLAGSRKDIGRVHVESVLALVQLQVGRRTGLPYRMQAQRTYDGIRIYREAHREQEVEKTYTITCEQLRLMEEGENITIDVKNAQIRLRILDFHGKMQEIGKNKYTKWLNYDKIKTDVQIRTRMSGDYLTIDEAGHKKKLKEYLIEEKIPVEKRDEIWLLAEQSHIIWVIGGRISAGYKIDKDTIRVLEVQITGGNYHED